MRLLGRNRQRTTDTPPPSPTLSLKGGRWGCGFVLSVVSLALCIDAAVGAVPVERVGKNDRAAAEPLAVVSLRAESTVRGPEIRLGDVADIQGVDPALTELLRGIEIGRAPLPGLTRALDFPYLKARLRFQKIDPSTLMWDVPPKLSVTTASQRVTGADLLAAVRTYIQTGQNGDATRLSIQSTTNPPDLLLPAGALELRVRGRPPDELTGLVTVTVEAWVDGALTRSVNVPVRVSQRVEVLVAARPVARHVLLGAEDVRTERREMVSGQDPLRNLGAIIGRRAIRGISPGEPMLAGMVEFPPLVRRGDVVVVIAEGQGLRATALGEAREEGKAGDVVRVRNLSSGREVYGQVEAERTIRVPF